MRQAFLRESPAPRRGKLILRMRKQAAGRLETEKGKAKPQAGKAKPKKRPKKCDTRLFSHIDGCGALSIGQTRLDVHDRGG